MSGGKVESCNRIKDRKEGLVVGGDDARNTYKEDLHNVDTEEGNATFLGWRSFMKLLERKDRKSISSKAAFM